MNPLFQQQNSSPNIVQQFMQFFYNSYTGNAEQRIQQMLNTGKATQQQYQEALNRANEYKNQIFGMFGMR